jgi:membrane-associated protease RseP (regulator of RpoE activity)
MNLKKALYFPVFGSLVLMGAVALAQQPEPVPPTPPVPGQPPAAFSMFFGGGSYLGVHTEDVTKENVARYNMRDVRGVGITEVVKDSPAERAGLRKDDVIVRFEGDNVTSTRKLTRLVSEVAPDHTVRLTISRGGSEQEVSVTIGKREGHMSAFRTLEGMKGLEGLKGLDKLKELHKNIPPGANVWKWEGPAGIGSDSFVYSFGGGRRIGVSTMQLTKQLADYFGIADGKGVLVTSVGDDSPAAKAGIRAGDVIVSVDGEKVEGSGDVSRAINKKKDGDVTLTVIRDKNQRSITVTPKAAESLFQPGSAPRVGRVIVPRIEIGAIPAINVVTPRIELPVIPEVNIVIGDEDGKPRIIRRGVRQPI